MEMRYLFLAGAGFIAWKFYKHIRNLEIRVFLLERSLLEALTAVRVHEAFLTSAPTLEKDRTSFPDQNVGIPKQFGLFSSRKVLDESASIRERDSLRHDWAWGLKALESNDEDADGWRSIFAPTEMRIDCGDNIEGRDEARALLNALRLKHPDMISEFEAGWIDYADQYLAYLQRKVPVLYYVFTEYGRPIPDELRKLAAIAHYEPPADLKPTTNFMVGKPGPYSKEAKALDRGY